MKKRAASSVTGVSSGADFSKSGTNSRRAFGIHDRARQLVGANLAALFEDVDILGGEFRLRAAFVVLLNQIGEMEGAGEPGRSGADDEDVGFELFALNGHL